MVRYRDDTGMTAIQARETFQLGTRRGYVNMVDGPQPHDPEGTVVAVIIDVRSSLPIRCALTRQQAKNLASRLMEYM